MFLIHIKIHAVWYWILDRYRKSVKPSLFTVWYWHFSIKKEIEGFKKKNILPRKPVKSSQMQIQFRAFAMSHSCPCRSWLVPLSQLCSGNHSASLFHSDWGRTDLLKSTRQPFGNGSFAGIPLLRFPLKFLLWLLLRNSITVTYAIMSVTFYLGWRICHPSLCTFIFPPTKKILLRPSPLIRIGKENMLLICLPFIVTGTGRSVLCCLTTL